MVLTVNSTPRLRILPMFSVTVVKTGVLRNRVRIEQIRGRLVVHVDDNAQAVVPQSEIETDVVLRWSSPT